MLLGQNGKIVAAQLYKLLQDDTYHILLMDARSTEHFQAGKTPPKPSKREGFLTDLDQMLKTIYLRRLGHLLFSFGSHCGQVIRPDLTLLARFSLDRHG